AEVANQPGEEAGNRQQATGNDRIGEQKTENDRSAAPDGWVQAGVFRPRSDIACCPLPVACCLFPIRHFLFSVLCSLFPVFLSRIPGTTAESSYPRRRPADSRRV